MALKPLPSKAMSFALAMFILALGFPSTKSWAFDVPIKPEASQKPTGATASTPKRKATSGSTAAEPPRTNTAPAEDPLVRAQRDMLSLSAQGKYKAGDKAGALADWRELEKLGKPTADLYYWIGLTELELEHIDAADEALKRNIRLSVGQGEHYQDVLALMQRSGSVRAAVKAKAEQAERNKALVSQAIANGGTFKECEVCPKMKVIPAGSFTMGSPGSEPARQSDEGPQHAVRIKPFAAGVYAVTFDEWDACVADGGCDGFRPDDKGWGRGNRPVINVNWRQAKAYTQWLSTKTNQTYRLLSEAEWEYAARAGTSTPFYTGWCIDTSQANYDGKNSDYNSCGAKTGSYVERTKPVGTYAPNAFGLYDMAGNVWQWVEDAYHDSYVGAPDDGSAWTSGGDQSRRVLRGGSWGDYPWFLRSAFRGRGGTSFANTYVGFRIARTF